VFRKVLIANRGEIAVRIIRALRELGIRSVAVFSEVDRGALHVRMADEAAPIGPAESSASYLNPERILDAARRHNAEAIHPGYGFLSENADFAAACEEAGFVFIGPPPAAIRTMGLKTAARDLAREAGVPVIPGGEGELASLEQARAAAAEAGYPVMLKAAAGGGGKGMRRVDREVDLAAAFRDASSEAERAFRNPAMYIEKLLVQPRHIEVQVLGDQHGHMVHLGERECSVQRRHQKLIEESPSPLVTEYPELRDQLGEAALGVARRAGYTNAGTVEFLVDQDRRFYFLEMNTRLQVEHPVTELVTGLDLVHWQLRIAAGERLAFRQDEISWRGAAMECRICAENPDRNFVPSPGRLLQIDRPSGPGIRIDSGVYPGWTVPIEYDPLLAKLVVWAGSRGEAIERMLGALTEYFIAGIPTNVSYFRRVIDDGEFRAGRLHTGFLEEFSRRPQEGACPGEVIGECSLALTAGEALCGMASKEEDDNLPVVAALIAAVHVTAQSSHSPAEEKAVAIPAWRWEGRRRLLQ
jgi:acetyl-CoA carboxylase biotin carboxylase subunit